MAEEVRIVRGHFAAALPTGECVTPAADAVADLIRAPRAQRRRRDRGIGERRVVVAVRAAGEQPQVAGAAPARHVGDDAGGHGAPLGPAAALVEAVEDDHGTALAQRGVEDGREPCHPLGLPVGRGDVGQACVGRIGEVRRVGGGRDDDGHERMAGAGELIGEGRLAGAWFAEHDEARGAVVLQERQEAAPARLGAMIRGLGGVLRWTERGLDFGDLEPGGDEQGLGAELQLAAVRCGEGDDRALPQRCERGPIC